MNGQLRRTHVAFSTVTLSLAALSALSHCSPPPAAQSPASPAPEATAAPEAAPSAAEPKAARGRVTVLASDPAVLKRPTTAALRGESVWVSIGQLSALFEPGVTAQLPFHALEIPLAGGAAKQRADLPGKDYYPEGIAAGADGALFIGSIMQGVISKISPNSTKAEPFLKGAHRGVIGLTVDNSRKLLWYCDSNPKAKEPAGELVGVQLTDAKEVVRHSLSAAAKPPFCNDVIVNPAGDLYVTDSAGGQLFKISANEALTANSAKVWAQGGAVAPPPTGGSGPNGLDWLDGALIVAHVGLGTLLKFDPASPSPLDTAQTIALTDSAGESVTLCSPDGVERVPGASAVVVVENGGCERKQPRVVRVDLEL
jgi:sugar lactone lactonase YvrE